MQVDSRASLFGKLRAVKIAVVVLLGVIALLALTGNMNNDPAAAQDQTAPPPATVPALPTATLTPIPTNTQPPTLTPSEPAPTLIPPTRLPTLTPTPFNPPTNSGLAVAQNLGRLRVGTYYNAEPFTWLNDFGEVVGYEPDIIRAIAIELGIEVEFVQVTRQNNVEMLISERIDILLGQQVHSRDRDEILDFTHPYYVNQQKMVVLTDAPYNSLADLTGLAVSVPIGSRSERALRNWSQLNGVEFDLRTYFTESSALDALEAGEVQAMVGEWHNLLNAGRQGMRFIDESIELEYYAMAIRPFDVNLRNLLNRSLQRLKASGRLKQIHEQWFPTEAIDFSTLVPVYDELYEDGRALSDFPIDMPYPANPVADRITAGLPLRVAGIMQANETTTAQVRITNALNQALIEDMARRWGVQVQYVPNSTLNAVDLVANGQADIAVGVSPRWDGADRVEYSQPYIKHGDRLLVMVNENVTTFADMLGTGWWIGYFADDAADADNIVKYAEHFGVGLNIREPFAIQREEDALFAMVSEDNLDAIYGDNLRLLALVREGGYESAVKILDTPYGDDKPLAFAMPRNDANFRALVNETLQDMAVDGTYQSLWTTHFGLGDPLPIPAWIEVNPDVLLR
ncbi:MAG: transporter substrate-binding domain-containing protein [Anaerolineae bacterium]|nr:transporter substrate-binding domain-containing protein [Anaerolineae bacterium]